MQAIKSTLWKQINPTKTLRQVVSDRTLYRCMIVVGFLGAGLL